MTYDYRSRIQERYEHLSPSYRTVADFVMANYLDAAFMTAAQIAQAVALDVTTVVRSAQRLGYSGFPEFSQQLHAHVKAEFVEHAGAGKQNYVEALTAWMQHHEYRCNYVADPSDVDAQAEAARLYGVALEKTQRVLGRDTEGRER